MDDRGRFMESFSERRVHDALNMPVLSVQRVFEQGSDFRSSTGALRELSYQLLSHIKDKVVRALYAATFGLTVDMCLQTTVLCPYAGWGAASQSILCIPEG